MNLTRAFLPSKTKFAIGVAFYVATSCGGSSNDDSEDGDDGRAGKPTGEAGETATGGTSTGGGSGGDDSPPAGGHGEDPGDGGSPSGTGGDSSGGLSGTGGAGGGATGGASGKGGAAGAAGSAAGTMGAGGANGGAGNGGTGGNAAGNGGTGGSAAGKGGTGGGGASGTLLFFDDFESGTSRWTPTPSGVWATTTDGSTVYAATAAQPSSVMRSATAGEPTWTDVTIDARVKITGFTGTSSGYFAGVCARYQSSSTYACFTLRSNGQVGFRVNGSNTVATNPPGGSIVENTWYSVRVVAIGSNITAFVNGTEIDAASRVTSGAPTSGRIALAAPGTNAVFDDVRVTAP
jgi:hypothetical protein